MATNTHTQFGGARRRHGRAALLASVLAGSLVLVVLAGGGAPALPAELEGETEVSNKTQEPDAIEIAFQQESYRPGSTARLHVWTAVRDATVQVFHVGPERQLTIGNNVMEGIPVTKPVHFASLRQGQIVSVRVRSWQSGLYFARVTSSRRLGFAPFVVAPKRLGEHRVAVVMPTRTWQAYNFRDDDRDGHGDTWYATRGHLTARLHRPFLNRGVPYHFRSYDLRFLRWLHQANRGVDILSQAELDATSGRRLAAAYDLLIFPGHHEYVTTREYDAVTDFRDRGGNLMFLSANNFFWRIDLRDGVMTRVAKWRDLGRPESALLGVQYIGNDMGERRGPWLVRSGAASRELFAGIALRNGNEFSDAGIEIDATSPASPKGTQVLAEVPDLLGPGMTAQMTYYETKAGARVFAAGAFSLAGSVRQSAVQRLLTNLWDRLADEDAAASRVANDVALGR